jgi:acetyltransferase-like isoleucine patch superfamily enzyme
MARIARLYRSLMLFMLPARAARLLLGRRGRAIHPSARIGFSWIDVDSLELGPKSRIGHLNVIRIRSLKLGPGGFVHMLNRVRGPLDFEAGPNAGLGNSNTVRKIESGSRPALLKLGIWAKITSRHHVDMTESVTLGDYTTVAGAGSQIWTHGYVHAEEGLDRYRIDGPVTLGNNVYIGSMSFISMGVRIADGVIVGGGAAVGKSLLEKGLYVSSPLRCLPRPADPDVQPGLERDTTIADEIVYRKVAP